ncbi:MAG: fibronectin-binding autotransporter adhesin [Verrucomicrobiales bacterium]|jgi:fibronectin-binding autotransporter adhesin
MNRFFLYLSLSALLAFPALAQFTLDTNTNNIDRLAGGTWWLDDDNSGNAIGVTNINSVATPDGALPGWAWTQSGFLVATNGLVTEITPADSVTNLITAGVGEVFEQSAVMIMTNNLDVGSWMTRADLQINAGSTLSLDQGGLLFDGGSHSVRSTAGGGFLTSTYDPGTGTNELFLIGASTASGSGQNAHTVSVVIQDGGKPTQVISDGFAPLLTGQMNLGTANTYTGGTLINRVRTRGSNVQSFGTGPVVVRDNNGQAWLTAGGTYANDFYVAGNGWQENSGFLGTIRFATNVRIGGNVILTADARLCPWEGTVTAWVDGDVLGEDFVLEKWGNGRLILAGQTTVDQLSVAMGTLQFGVAGADTTLSATNGISVSANRTLQGYGAIEGVVTVDGTLTPGEPGSIGTMQIPDGLVLNAGSTLRFDLMNGLTDHIEVGTLSQFDSSTLNIQVGGQLANGTYRLMTYDDLNSTVTGFNITGNTTRKDMTVSAEFGEVILTVSGTDSVLTWTPFEPTNTWDLNNTTNWVASGIPSAFPSPFLDADSVLFDDSGATTNAVNLVGVLSPGSALIDATTNYTFAGAGSLSGLGVLTKDGTGSLTIDNNNAGFGGEMINTNGVLKANNDNALGDKVGGTTVYPEGTLDVNARDLGAEPIRILGDGFNGLGAIINSAGAQLNAAEQVTLLGDATIGGTGRWDIRGAIGTTILSTGGNPYNLTKVGPNQIALVDCTVDPALNDIYVMQGHFAYETTTTGLGNPAGSLVVTNNSLFSMYRASPLDKRIVVSGGSSLSSRNAANTLLGPIEVVNGQATLEAQVDFTVANEISGPGAFRKTGGGNLFLTGDNSYTGGTRVEAGTLWVGRNSAAGSLGTGPVDLVSVLRVDRSNPVAITNAITGTGAIQLFGTNEVALSSVDLGTDAGASIRVGFNAGGTPTLVITNGSISVGRLFTGENPTFAGNIRQEGGRLSVLDTTDPEGPLRIAHWPNEVSTYDMMGGELFVPNGRISLGIDGTGIWNISGGTATVNRVEVNGRNNTGGGALSLSGGVLALGAGGLVNEGVPYTVNFSGGTLRAETNCVSTVATALSNTTIINSGAYTLTLSGVLSGSGGLSKVGPGTLLLSGANTFTNGFHVTDGTVLHNGSHVGAGRILVDAIATFGGTGSSDADVDVEGTLGAGESIGTLTLTGDLTVNGTLAVEVDAGGNDLVQGIAHLELDVASVLSVSGTIGTNIVILTYTTREGIFGDVSSVTGQGYEVVYDDTLGEVRLETVPPPDIITRIEQVGGRLEVSWDAVPGSEYDLVFKLDLSEPMWTPVPGFTNLTGSGSTTLTNALPDVFRGYLRIATD